MNIVMFFLLISPIVFGLRYFISNGIRELIHCRRARRVLAAENRERNKALMEAIGAAFGDQLAAQFSRKPPVLTWVDDKEQALADGAPAARRDL